MQSDSSRFAREADRDSAMATEGHRHAGKKSKAEELAKMDEELADIKREIEKLELRMRQEIKSRWVHEWPMQKPKASWPVKQLMVMRQRRLLRKWLRYVENLKATKEEEMVHICEPEIGDILGEENDQRSLRDLIDCQEGSGRFPNCQMGKGTEMRSAEDLMDCQEDSEEILHCQSGNDQRSLRDLEDCQEGSGSILNCSGRFRG
jgi:hypothetical protein